MSREIIISSDSLDVRSLLQTNHKEIAEQMTTYTEITSNPVVFMILLKKLQKAIEIVMKNEKVNTLVEQDVRRHGKDNTRFNVTFTIGTTYTSYNYSDSCDPEYGSILACLEALNNRKKEIEEQLRNQSGVETRNSFKEYSIVTNVYDVEHDVSPPTKYQKEGVRFNNI